MMLNARTAPAWLIPFVFVAALTRNFFLQSVQFGICALRHDRRGQTQQCGRYDY